VFVINWDEALTLLHCRYTCECKKLPRSNQCQSAVALTDGLAPCLKYIKGSFCNIPEVFVPVCALHIAVVLVLMHQFLLHVPDLYVNTALFFPPVSF
jgi:hypothetical protein